MSTRPTSRDSVFVAEHEDGTDVRTHVSWYRGETCNFGPTQTQLKTPDAWERFILPGWVPDKPVILPRARVMTVGSCFARSVSRYLRAARADLCVNENVEPGTQEAAGVSLFFFGGGFVNTYTMLQQFEWGLGLREISGGTLFGEHTKSFYARTRGPKGKRIIELPTSPEVRKRTGKTILQTDAFIFTLGLSEVWEDKETGEAFFKAVPKDLFDENKHAFRLSTVEENLKNIERLYAILRERRPHAPLIFTLSPVPLSATFRPVSCVTANAVSKAILRIALDQFMAAHPDDTKLFYWPSYEMVSMLGAGAFDEKLRHVDPKVVTRIMTLFDKYFLVSA